MKVVLFSGGRGMRLRDYSQDIPKPMVTIGPRPILWHLMKYYAYYGHREFIICLGWQANVVKDYFLNYDETASNDFTLSRGGRDIRLMSSDIDDWEMTFVDTGINASVGERLMAVREHLRGEDMFLANYSDGLTDLRLPDLIESAQRSGNPATFLAVHPAASFHMAKVSDNGLVEEIVPITQSGLWINGGFFALSQEIFEFIRPGEDLVAEPFERLIAAGRLTGYCYTGFWMAMDTFKDRMILEERYQDDDAPWQVWLEGKAGGAATASD